MEAYLRAEAVEPIHAVPLAECKRLAELARNGSVHATVHVDRNVIGRAFRAYLDGQWSADQLDDWGHFVRWGFHPGQFKKEGKERPPVKEGEVPLTQMAGLKVEVLSGDAMARQVFLEVLEGICRLFEKHPAGEQEGPHRAAAQAWLGQFADAQ